MLTVREGSGRFMTAAPPLPRVSSCEPKVAPVSFPISAETENVRLRTVHDSSPPTSKGELLRAKSGTGGLSNLGGDGERSGIIPTPWGVGERRIVACKSSMGTLRGAG
jgi:hypothetical protein